MGSISMSGPDESGGEGIDLAAYNRILDVNNSLQAFGATSGLKDLDLPCIFVVGDESVGKSSLLEAISGVRFPTGGDIVTRCPILLIMSQTDEVPTYKVEWEPPTTPGRVHIESATSAKEVAGLISRATEVVCGKGKTIVNRVITVTVRHKNAPNLTLMDLPGLKNNRGSTESEGVCEEVSKLVKHRLKEKQAIILCVLDSRIPMTNQGKAWKLTREFDKGRNKTLVVFTKPDAELEGETTRDLVATAVGDYPVELNGQSAYHAVRLRAKTETGDDLAESSRKETAFFEAEVKKANGTAYPCVTGRKALTDHLTKHLKAQLIKFIPQLREQVRELSESTQEKIDAQSGGKLDVDYLRKLKRGVAEVGLRVENLCNGHTRTTNVEDRRIHPKWKNLGDEFRDTILAKDDENLNLPFWFFSEDCREKVAECIVTREGLDTQDLKEHPDHVKAVFRENIWSRLAPGDIEDAKTSPVTHMLEEVQKAVDTAIRSVLSDPWKLQSGPSFKLPDRAQEWIMDKVRCKILATRRREAQDYLRSWRYAQASTMCTFNPRYIVISKHLVAEFTKMYTEMDSNSAPRPGAKKQSDPPSLESMITPTPGEKADPDKPTTGRAAREVATKTLMTVLSMLLPVPNLAVAMDTLVEALYQALKKLAKHIVDAHNKPDQTSTKKLCDTDTEETKSRLQLVLAAASMTLLEGWYQQVPTAIEHFMISEVGHDMGIDLFEKLGMRDMDDKDLLELMRPTQMPEESLESLQAKTARLDQFKGKTFSPKSPVEIEKLAEELAASQAIRAVVQNGH